MAISFKNLVAGIQTSDKCPKWKKFHPFEQMAFEGNATRFQIAIHF
jgi:hypothetical protein